MTRRCSVCAAERPLEEFLVVWPVGRPARARFVCRPSLWSVAPVTCFRAGVCCARHEAIAAAGWDGADGWGRVQDRPAPLAPLPRLSHTSGVATKAVPERP